MLAALAHAIAEHRRATGDYKEDELYAEKPFTWLIHRLAEAGCNLLQKRRCTT